MVALAALGQKRSRSVVGVGTCVLLVAAATSWLFAPASEAFASSGVSADASRRTVAAGLVAGLFGVSPAMAAIPGQVNAVGDDESADVRIGRDSEEDYKKRRIASIEFEKNMEAKRVLFRGMFTKFAGNETSLPDKAQILGSMKEIVLADRGLPIGITRDDVVKGVRAVKFNNKCTKRAVKEGECKILEKSYVKLLASIDQVTDRSLITATR
mmetsp:Transcript_147253/g.472980  ORF Transcript_147253/g.472980 Transcript_147253/m.472980 type:complete len:212 (+) Transcript_147253:67-702(+)